MTPYNARSGTIWINPNAYRADDGGVSESQMSGIPSHDICQVDGKSCLLLHKYVSVPYILVELWQNLGPVLVTLHQRTL